VAHLGWVNEFASAIFILHFELDVLPVHLPLFFRGAWFFVLA
jgi:hypothetical protein